MDLQGRCRKAAALFHVRGQGCTRAIYPGASIEPLNVAARGL
ncbi:hypothetical protein SAMN04490248_12524 [Salinihabitans flavidus]|uniref:Uncharacterized protein n=1 Tax=Salinihabitans flavidus TaxID=569882 RepID=A0A1H8V4G2_9RHOB|nr:hypothetical protein SAMN04490248_12524 [Salinihabitans flavidus]